MRQLPPIAGLHRPRHLLRAVAALAVGATAVVGCGDSNSDSNGDSSGAGASTSTAAESAAAPTTTLVKPAVSLPQELPTELVITDLTAGSGPAAAAGDTVIVHYVGVRSANGEEFDNSYDRGAPIDVVLGAGSVIAGWDQGLLGSQAGGRRQLDIPAELAYGQNPRPGGPIQPGDALSFVIDVVAVLPASDAADEPQVSLSPAPNVAELASTDLIVGTGTRPVDGSTVAVHIVSFRADNAQRLASDWDGPPLTFEFSATSQVYPGILAAVKGMQIGGRRQVQIPYVLMFDGLGSEGLGLPPSIDLVVVIDLVAVY
jgi:peptidylprolyl isomerase